MSLELLNEILNEVNEMKGLSLQKADVIAKIKARKDHYKPEDGNPRMVRVDYIQVGDIVAAPSARGMHPAIVFSVDGINCSCVSLSSKEGPYNIYKFKKTRYFKNGWATNWVVKMPLEEAKAHWKGVFDNKKELEKIVSLLKKWYSSNLKIKHGKKQAPKKTEDGDTTVESRQAENI